MHCTRQTNSRQNFLPCIRCLWIGYILVVSTSYGERSQQNLTKTPVRTAKMCGIEFRVSNFAHHTVCCFIAVCMFQCQHGGNSAHPRAPCPRQCPPCHRFGPVHVSPQLFDDGILPRGEQWRGALASPIWWGVPAKPPLIHILTRVRFECHWGGSGLHLCPQHTRNGCQWRGGKFRLDC